MLPSRKGRSARILPGVRPIIRLASSPKAMISRLSRSIATTDASRRMIPLPFM